jgi:GT2 family glycosyltransferase
MQTRTHRARITSRSHAVFDLPLDRTDLRNRRSLHDRSYPPRELSPVAADIIILEWNRPDDTIAAIQSALSQTQVSRRIWVVDQGSDPANRAKLTRFCSRHPEVHIHQLPRNIGVAAGRNFATRLGAAPYVISLDNDGVFADELCVSRAIARLESQPELGGVAFRILDGVTENEEMYWDYPRAYLHSDCASFEVTRFLGGGHALRREAFERAGSYDESLFFSGEERDLAWRMIRHGYRLRLYRDLAVRHRSVPDSKLSWADRRYYFTARNALYINHKFGAGRLGFVRGAASFLIRGLRNGLAPAAVRGILAAMAMSIQHDLSAEDKSDYALTRDMRRYIAETDHKDRESVLDKLRRQLQELPRV